MPQSLYRIVFDKIIERIVDGTYPPGSMLPSEIDLGAELGVSQGTARKSLIDLEQKGIVERRQGRGTFVTLRTPENSLFHFFRLRDEDGIQVVPTLAEEAVTKRSATPEERASLSGNPTEVVEIERVRHFRNRPLCLEKSVVSAALFPGLQERCPLPNTLYVLFQQAYACVIISAEDNLSAGLLDPEYSARLDTAPSTPVIIADRKSYDLLNRVVELRKSVFVTENVTYSVKMD